MYKSNLADTIARLRGYPNASIEEWTIGNKLAEHWSGINQHTKIVQMRKTTQVEIIVHEEEHGVLYRTESDKTRTIQMIRFGVKFEFAREMFNIPPRNSNKIRIEWLAGYDDIGNTLYLHFMDMD